LRKAITSVVMVFLTLASVLVVGGVTAQPSEKVPVIVGFKDKPDADLIRAHGGRIKYVYNIIPAIACELPEQATDALRKNPNVKFVEPDYEVYIDVTPNDPRFSELWGLHNTGQTGGAPDADIDAPEAWDIQTGSSSMVIAVIDTGVDYKHVDLSANIWTNPGEIAGNGIDDEGNGYVDDVYGWDFYNNDNNPMDDHRHGTHCAGTIAAVGNNGAGVVGVNWAAKIMALKFLSAGGSGYTSDAIAAVQYATMMKQQRGIPVIAMSNSWGGGGFSQALKDAITAADNAGILFIAAAGNSDSNNDLLPHYPSSYDVPNVIAVAATDHKDALASWSNYGATSVDLAAPGVSILSTVLNNGYSLLSGTSMATPHVSGVSALIKAQAPAYTHLQIKDLILSSVDPVPGLSGKMVTGGRLNAYNALLQSVDTTLPAQVTEVTVNTVSSSQLHVSWKANTEQDLHHYNVYRSTTSGFMPSQADLIASPATNSYSDTGLTPSTIYYYKVTAVDKAGNEGMPSLEASGMTSEAPAQPTMHVASIEMSTGSRKAGRNTFVWAIAKVTIIDAYNVPVKGATVYGHWESATTDSDSGITDASGQVSLKSDSVKKALPGTTTFVFVVENVVLSGWTYNPSASVTRNSITV